MFRFARVIVAIAIIFSLEYWWRVEWYIAVPLGIIGYLALRYAEYFVANRRYLKNMIDAAKRDQNSKTKTLRDDGTGADRARAMRKPDACYHACMPSRCCCQQHAAADDPLREDRLAAELAGNIVGLQHFGAKPSIRITGGKPRMVKGADLSPRPDNSGLCVRLFLKRVCWRADKIQDDALRPSA
jgi:hypothetical protein